MAFTVIETAVGAALIQFATTNYYWQLGETIGFSSLVYNFVTMASSAVQVALGVLGSSLFVKKFLPQFVPQNPESVLVSSGLFSQTGIFCVSGFIVGMGTKWGCGCTSGHMIAGLSRLSKRSLVATATFASFAAAVVTFGNLGAIFGDFGARGVPNYTLELNWHLLRNSWLVAVLAAAAAQVYVVLPFLSRVAVSSHSNAAVEFLKVFNRILSGFLFGLGLHVAGMVNVAKTVGFLSFLRPVQFDPSLSLIMVFAVLPNIVVWRHIEKPLLVPSFSVATSSHTPPLFLLGNALFGLGWGLLGVCPGPGFINILHHIGYIHWLASFVVGRFAATSITGWSRAGTEAKN